VGRHGQDESGDGDVDIAVRGRHRRRLAVVLPIALAAVLGALAVGADFLQYDSTYGTWRSASLWGSAIGIVLVVACFATPVTRRRRRVIGVFGLVTGLAVVSLVLSLTAGYTEPTGTTAAPASPASRSAPATHPTSPLGDGEVSASDACGEPALVSRPLPSVHPCVVYWCKGQVYLPDGTEDHHHLQIKLRPRISVNSMQPVAIGIGNPSALRLLVRSNALPGDWGAPARTRAAGDRPVLVQWNGQQVWAVPPNVNGDAQPTAGQYYSGFATDWHATSVGHGSSYFSPLVYGADHRPDEQGDLVFQLPVDASGKVDVVGFAVVTPVAHPVVLAVAPRSSWPAPSDPGSF
jgi:hypothetical protein